MASSLFSPSPQRNFKGQRWVRISLRTAHLIGMAFLVGGTAQGHAPADQPAALWATLVSGLLFIAIEVFNTGVWLVQLSGLAVMAKVLLLAAAVAAPGSGVTLLVIAIVIGGISSHMPGKYRYYSLWHGRIVKEE